MKKTRFIEERIVQEAGLKAQKSVESAELVTGLSITGRQGTAV